MRCVCVTIAECRRQPRPGDWPAQSADIQYHAQCQERAKIRAFEMWKPKVRRRTVSGVLGAGSEERSTRLRESALAEYNEQTRLSAGTVTNCCPKRARTTSREQPPIRRAGVLVSIVSFARAQTNNKTINAPITSLRRISVMVCG